MKPELPPEWEVPDFTVDEFAPRAERYCIGIPVINEGEKIRRQLLEMQKLELGGDVIIADGGSTDGSVAPEFVAGAGVRTLLTKTGPGKQSAQLRMLFAYALSEGYEGVITIDGNGKDGLEGLQRVRTKLAEGYDFVQGSRYLRDGQHANTPADRLVAVRFLHAPLLSLAAGFRYTDTTNGLRGWSSRFLGDPRVAAFRDVFDTYNLHYYLSVRAPRLGYRVCEVPARREYPASEPTPSKIQGLGPRLHIVKLLLLTVLGAYDPPDEPGRAGA